VKEEKDEGEDRGIERMRKRRRRRMGLGGGGAAEVEGRCGEVGTGLTSSAMTFCDGSCVNLRVL
jgi:hypothetical protein